MPAVWLRIARGIVKKNIAMNKEIRKLARELKCLAEPIDITIQKICTALDFEETVKIFKKITGKNNE